MTISRPPADRQCAPIYNTPVATVCAYAAGSANYLRAQGEVIDAVEIERRSPCCNRPHPGCWSFPPIYSILRIKSKSRALPIAKVGDARRLDRQMLSIAPTSTHTAGAHSHETTRAIPTTSSQCSLPIARALSVGPWGIMVFHGTACSANCHAYPHTHPDPHAYPHTHSHPCTN